MSKIEMTISILVNKASELVAEHFSVGVA